MSAPLTPATARWLLDLVNGITLTVAAPDFDDAVAHVLAARAELTALLEGRGDTPEPPAGSRVTTPTGPTTGGGNVGLALPASTSVGREST